MSNLSTDVNNLKKMYREIFLKSSEEINRQIKEIKPENKCSNCTSKCGLEQELFEQFPEDCAYKDWQKNVLTLFDEKILKDVYNQWVKIAQYRELSGCVGCGACCKLASSEFSYEELKIKARNGDNFATQFISVFIPYQNESDAQKIYPEYFELLKEKNQDENIYFYHCPKVTGDNRCSDYENRPQICRDFPDNPLSLLPAACGFWGWKKEVEPTALMLHAMLEIIDFYKSKITN